MQAELLKDFFCRKFHEIKEGTYFTVRSFFLLANRGSLVCVNFRFSAFDGFFIL